MENYMYFKLMKNVAVKLKPGVIPHIFDCQKQRKSMHSQAPRNAFLKRERLRELEPSTSAKRVCSEKITATDIQEHSEESEFCRVAKADKRTQVNLKVKTTSKAIQCSILKKPKQPKLQMPDKLDISNSSKSSSRSSASFKISISSHSDVERINSDTWNFKENVEQRTIYVIEKNPKLYIGVPIESMFIIDQISTMCQLTKIELYVTLKKIRLNLPYKILADDFCLSASTVCAIIKKSLPKLVTYLKPFIQWKSLSEIQKCLPIPFRMRYKNVQCIIDCFEIAIQKPQNPVLQSFSWSEYKKCNTMKYLISCTPDGLISYVSDGFGGRITDKKIVEESGFLKNLENGAHIMADRGFKHIDEFLAAGNNVLVRPPSVSSTVKSSKQKVKEAKRIASLRIHIERVISRIREYAILQPHAQVHRSLIKYLDYIVLIACALINLQNYLIK